MARIPTQAQVEALISSCAFLEEFFPATVTIVVELEPRRGAWLHSNRPTMGTRRMLRVFKDCPLRPLTLDAESN